jgi:hypothetical protein
MKFYNLSVTAYFLYLNKKAQIRKADRGDELYNVTSNAAF